MEENGLVELKDLNNAVKNITDEYILTLEQHLNTSIWFKEFINNITTTVSLKYLKNYTITDKVIDTIKRMSFEQRIEELEFFKMNNKEAYNMMKKILDDLDLGYGEKTKEMVEIVNGYDISNLV